MTALAFAAAFVALIFSRTGDDVKIFLGFPLIIIGSAVIVKCHQC